MEWLFEARKRYEISILNYMVTSNHIHLLVLDGGDRDPIPKSIQLIAGERGKNTIKERKERELFGRIVIMLQRWRVMNI